jgi:uncharacterized protein (DUF2267 family)
MNSKPPTVIQRSVESALAWINDMASELDTDDEAEALRLFRAFLHALRDRLTIDEGAQLAAQLPELIRGVFYEGWVPAHAPATYHDVDSFLKRIADEARLAGPTEASYAAAAAAVLRRHVSAGELADVSAVLPAPVRELVAADGPDGGR